MADRLRTPVPRWVPFSCAPLVTVVAGVASWWLVGDISSDVAPRDQLDYLITPPAVAPAVETGGGLVAAGLGVGVVLVVALGVRAGVLARPWSTLAVVLALCGVVLGGGARVLTAGGIGANIGAGLVVLFVAPLLGLVLLLALGRAVYLLRHGPGRAGRA